MSKPPSILSRTLLATLVVLSASLAHAQSLTRGSLTNFSFYNYSGGDADGFDLTLDNVTPLQIKDLWKADYPNATLKQIGRSTTIRWRGGKTPKGGSATFGITFPDLDMSQFPTAARFAWVRNNVPIAPARAVVWQFWITDSIRLDVIFNSTLGPVSVQRRATSLVAPSLSLNELLRGGRLWESAPLIDRAPVSIESGGSVVYPFDKKEEWSLMFYDQYENGRLVATFLNATNVPSDTLRSK